MKPKRWSKVVLIASAIIIIILLTACGGTSSTSQTESTDSQNEPTANKEPVIEVIKTGSQNERIAHTETEEKDFCDSPTGTKIQKEASINSSESLNISVSGELKGSVPGIEAKIGSAIQKAYGQTTGESTSETLEFPPGYHYQYTIEYYETWVEGKVLVTIGQEEPYSIPFEYRVSYGLHTSQVNVKCPPPEADFSVSGDAVGVAPFIVQFIDQSQGNITNWSWDFGDGSGISDMQSPSYTYDQPSYIFKEPNVCFETGTYNVSLTVSNAHGSGSKSQEALITVLPKEYTVRVQVDPIALEDGIGYKLLHLPGCSQTCNGGLNLSGKVLAGACLTSVASDQHDEMGYYLDRQMMALQASHRITYCPTGYAAIQPGVWVFEGWSDPDINNVDEQYGHDPEGDHNPVFTINKDLYVRAQYKWDKPCP